MVTPALAGHGTIGRSTISNVVVIVHICTGTLQLQKDIEVICLVDLENGPPSVRQVDMAF